MFRKAFLITICLVVGVLANSAVGITRMKVTKKRKIIVVRIFFIRNYTSSVIRSVVKLLQHNKPRTKIPKSFFIVSINYIFGYFGSSPFLMTFNIKVLTFHPVAALFVITILELSKSISIFCPLYPSVAIMFLFFIL